MAEVKSTDILSKINKKLNEIHPYGALMKDPNYLKVTGYISTGNYNLNMALSGSFFKGIPNSKVTAFCGLSGTGKSYLLLNIYKDALEQGYNIYHFDTEGFMDEDVLMSFGLYDYWHADFKPSEYENKLVVIPVAKVFDFTNMFTNIIDPLVQEYITKKPLPKILIGGDSLGNLGSGREYDNAKDGKDKADMGTAAKALRSFFRIVTVPCSALKIPVLFTNHVGIDVSSFMPTEKMGKGEGLTYAASNILCLAKAQLKEGDNKVGIVVTAKPMKNRQVIPRAVKFQINNHKGMNAYVGMQEYITDKTWDEIGIAKGTLDVEEIEKPVLDENNQPVLITRGKNKGEPKMEKVKTGNVVFTPAKEAKAPFAVRHLNRTIETAAEFFTPEVFTQEVMEKLEKLVAPSYKYQNQVSNPETSNSDTEELDEFTTIDSED